MRVCFAAILELLHEAFAHHPSPQPRHQGLPTLIHLVQLAAGEAVRLPGGLLDLRLPAQSTCECSPGDTPWGGPLARVRLETPSERSLEGNIPLPKQEKGTVWICHLSFYREGGEAVAGSSRRSWSGLSCKQTWRI